MLVNEVIQVVLHDTNVEYLRLAALLIAFGCAHDFNNMVLFEK